MGEKGRFEETKPTAPLESLRESSIEDSGFRIQESGVGSQERTKRLWTENRG
jgi:hypothetical protein